MPAKSLSRGQFLRLAGLVAAGAAAGCTPLRHTLGLALDAPLDLPALPPDGLSQAVFAGVNRLTFGPRLDERARAAEIGLAGWIEEQLAPETISDSACDLRLRQFDSLTMAPYDLAALSDRIFDEVDQVSVPRQLAYASLTRQIYSRRQLYELMVDFWGDHFNISVEKGDCWFLKTVDERQVLRPHALGRFRDLLWASAHSPAMLVYLDNQANQAGAPNENYARELLELHTLGEGNGYTQSDVQELARCLTGWGVSDGWRQGRFLFDPARHDDGSKTVLGLPIAAAGQAEAEAVIERLALHPNTATFIAFKLARRFIAEQPPAELVQRTARSFTRSGGDLRVVLRTLLLDGLPAMQPRFKRPLHFIASALRILQAQSDAGEAVQQALAVMGQPYFTWPTPDGYPDHDDAWNRHLAPRWQFALALARDALPGTRLEPQRWLGGAPAERLDGLSTLLLGAPLAPARRSALLAALASLPPDQQGQIIIAGLLAAPGFQWR